LSITLVLHKQISYFFQIV